MRTWSRCSPPSARRATSCWSRPWVRCTRATPSLIRLARERAGSRRRRRGVDLRQPAPVRAQRRPRPLPAHVRRGPGDVRPRGRRRGFRARPSPRCTPGGVPSTTGTMRPSPSTPARWPTILEGTHPPRPLPGRADRRRQAVRPGPARRRDLRREGLPAAGADPPAGRRPLHQRQARRARDRRARPPTARTTGSPGPAATATSTPSSAGRPPGSTGCCTRRAARRGTAWRPPWTRPVPSSGLADGVDLDYFEIRTPDLAELPSDPALIEPGTPARALIAARVGSDPADRQPGRHRRRTHHSESRTK